MSEDVVTCDVLVAGSGAAGFAAALTAHLEGLNVIMVEKEPLFGGTTAYSAGVVWVPANSHQRPAGITDSPAAALAYLAHRVGNRLERAKAEAFIDNAPAMLDCFARGICLFHAGADLGRLSSRRARRLARRPIARPGNLRRTPARQLVCATAARRSRP